MSHITLEYALNTARVAMVQNRVNGDHILSPEEFLNAFQGRRPDQILATCTRGPDQIITGHRDAPLLVVLASAIYLSAQEDSPTFQITWSRPASLFFVQEGRVAQNNRAA